MSVLALPMLAIGFGAFIVCAETCLHFGSIASLSSWVEWPVHDWIAGGGLVASGVVSGKDWNGGRPYQAAAWAFMTSLLMAAFVNTWSEWSEGIASDDWLSTGAWVVILEMLLAVSAAALAATLLKRSRGL
jgi:hypothetical protein